MTPSDAPRQLAHPLKHVALRGVRVLAVAAPLWAVGAALFAARFWPAFTDGMCITLMCWFFIDGGRMGVARALHRHDPVGRPAAASGWPGWPWMSGIIAGGTLLGYGSGQALSDWMLGRGLSASFDADWKQALPLLLVSLAPGIAITWFFYSRERLAQTEALAQSAQRQAAETRLKLLESQLEPHMLFNTLANLRVLIALDPPRAQAMLDRLIAFLRATLGASRSDSQSLAAEFDRLADYLTLMSVRMGDRLVVHFELPDALRDHPLPPLLLQPLAENAIRHGLEPKPDGGRIEVSAQRQGDDLLLCVRDTGAGLEADPRMAGTRFGLTQVRERLATLYGDRATLTLAPAAGGGVRASIRLPLDSEVAPLPAGITPQATPAHRNP